MRTEASSTPPRECTQFVVATGPFAHRPVGGMHTAITNDARGATEPLTIFSLDSEPSTIGNARIVPVPSTMLDTDFDVLTRWYECGYWQLLHPEAYLDPAIPSDLMEEMYAGAGVAVRDVDDLIRLIDETASAGSLKEAMFVSQWEKALASVPDGSTIDWQDFPVARGLTLFGERLSERGCRLLFHHHESQSQILARSQVGTSLLRHWERAAVLYNHTDDDCECVAEQFSLAGLRAPQLLRYDLGPDLAAIDRALQRIGPNNYRETFPGLDRISGRQRDLVEEIFATQDTVPHRFISLDRVDPIKGSVLLYRAIESLLDAEMSRGATLLDLQKKYRFFFLQETTDEALVFDGRMLNSRYGVIAARERRIRLEERFPGVVFTCAPLTGAARDGLPALLVGCHGMTAGVREGKNLAIMEIAYVNASPHVQSDVGICMGSGTGLSREAMRRGADMYISVPPAGSVERLCQALEELCLCQREKPGFLRGQLGSFVSQMITVSNSTMR